MLSLALGDAGISSGLCNLTIDEVDSVSGGAKADKVAAAIAIIEAGWDFVTGFVEGFSAGPG